MSYQLKSRERALLDQMQFDHRSFRIKGQLRHGFGSITINSLLQLGLLEAGAGRHGETGWRLTDDGWRCMYGKTHDEMMQQGGQHYPLRTWSWPPSTK